MSGDMWWKISVSLVLNFCNSQLDVKLKQQLARDNQFSFSDYESKSSCFRMVTTCSKKLNAKRLYF